MTPPPSPEMQGRQRLHAGLLSLALMLVVPSCAGAPSPIDHVEPPSWWTAMASQKLQVLVHGDAISARAPSIDYPGVRIDAVTRVANPNYLFIDLHIDASARPGTLDLQFGEGAAALHQPFVLRAREAGSAQRAGFGNADVIYALMPDRFANGDASNDTVAGLQESSARNARDVGGARHGGDIAGIIDHLDYIAAMGFTQLWPTPLVENDMLDYSYHGYAVTDHYRIDARYGSNADYRRLVDAARARGVGVIQDVVLSHVGARHWWLRDMPARDWTNYDGVFTPTRHHRMATQDPYGSRQDHKNFTEGWFGRSMPDLNQNNPLVANALIQNAIWWIEYAGLSGLRIDTYGYSDPAFLRAFSRRVLAEYPRLNMVGEEWHKMPATVAQWQKGKAGPAGYVGSMPSMMDFPLMYAMRESLVESTPGEAFRAAYETLATDFLYPDPARLVLFEGNHDLSRLYSAVGGDVDLWKMALAFTMTMPRIPQFYYGTEILMESSVAGRDDASYRRDFPGGWPGDQVNAFTGAGLSAPQRAARDHVAALVNWRKRQGVIHHGRTMQFGPEDDTWVYFRYADKSDGGQRVMVAFNKNHKAVSLPTARFQEILQGAASGVDALSGVRYDLREHLTIPARAALILEI